MSDKSKPEATGSFTHDSGFKDLVVDFPEDSVRMLLPDLESTYGKIQQVEFPRQEMRKQWLEDSGRELDIPIKIVCESGKVLLVLLEHKSDKSFSIYKLAHYTLDLMEQFPGFEIVPTVLFADDRRWRKDVTRSLTLTGLSETWLTFRFLKIKLKDIEAATVAESNNPVWHILSPLLKMAKGEQRQVLIHSYIKLKQLVSKTLFLKYVTFIDKYSKIEKKERLRIITAIKTEREGGPMLSQLLVERENEGEIKGKAEGKAEMQTEIAQNMIAQGFDLPTIAKVTEISLEKLERLNAKPA